MPNIASLYKRITSDFPQLTFQIDETFHWSAEQNTVFHPEIQNETDLLHLLHEISHAQLQHAHHPTDVSLLTMEREAWNYGATQLAPHYGIALAMDDDIVQEALDSYRQWLHARSTCPRCQAVGIEQSPTQYRCLACEQQWRVNQAKTCELRRYKQ